MIDIFYLPTVDGIKRSFLGMLDDASAYNVCVYCEEWWQPLLLLGGLTLIGMVGLLLYIWLIGRHPESMTKWVSTVAILVAHVQTVSIVANLRLLWPASVTAVASFADLDLVDIHVGVLRPDCLFSGLETEQGLYCAPQPGV